MKVVATQVGQYNQVLRVCDEQFEEVFELLKHPDGSDPVREDWVPTLDANGKDTGDGQYVVYKHPKTGKTVHRDLALDTGSSIIHKGPMRGEVIRSGWMIPVPDRVPCGFYPKGTDYWTQGVQIPQVLAVRQYGPTDKRSAPILTHAVKEAAAG